MSINPVGNGRWVRVLASLAALMSSGALAEAEQAAASVAKAAPASVGSAANLLNVVIGLALILGLILALAWLVRRLGQGGFAYNSHMKILAAMPLGTRERLLVVEVGGQQLLLGVTATQINTLHVFESPVIDSANPAQGSEFSRKLMAVLHKK